MLCCLDTLGEDITPTSTISRIKIFWGIASEIIIDEKCSEA
jgi:hypothetical protein